MLCLSITEKELYEAINHCLKPVKQDLAIVDKRVKSIVAQLDKIEVRVKNLGDQLTNIEGAVKAKTKV